MFHFLFISTLFAIIAYPAAGQQKDSTVHSLNILYSQTHLKKQLLSDWKMATIEYKMEVPKGAYIAHLNVADHLNYRGWQAGVEVYHKLSRKTYAYVAMDYASTVRLFPKFRSAVSYFISLPKGWEIEGGVRHMYFDRSVWIGSASVSKYYGKWIFNGRWYISKGLPGISNSYFLTSRLYFGKKNHFAFMQIGNGTSPDVNRNQIYGMNNKRVTKNILGGLQYFWGNRHWSVIHLGYEKEQNNSGFPRELLLGTAGYGIRL